MHPHSVNPPSSLAFPYHRGLQDSRLIRFVVSRDSFDCWIYSNTDEDSMYEIYIHHIELGNNRAARSVECLDKVRIHACE